MRLVDIVNAPWAITPEMHSEVQGIYARHMRGEKIDIKGLEAAIGRPLSGPTDPGYEVRDGVAIVSLEGVLAKRMNLMMAICGGTSMALASQAVRDAAADDAVRGIVLLVDSPGGTVDGCQELSDTIFEARSSKPIVTLCSGMMASAAYWTGSAASKVYISSLTDIVGSIGVVQAHTDVSGREAQAGIKTTEVTAGKYKRIASQYAPLSPEGKEVMQDQVDQTYSVFVNDVARNRGVSVQQVLEFMADGRCFIGQQAIDAGLVDGVSSMDDLISQLAAGEMPQEAGAPNAGKGQGAAAPVETQQADSAGAAPEATNQEKTMDVTQLKAEHPDVAEALINEGKALGATAERERIKAVEDQAMPGHEALVATLKYDGKTSGPEAAVQILKAEKAKKANTEEALRADAAAAAVPAAAAPQPGDENDDEDEDEDEDASASPSGGKPGKKASVTMQNMGAIAQRAAAYQAEQRAKGVKVSIAQAVDHVSKKGA